MFNSPSPYRPLLPINQAVAEIRLGSTSPIVVSQAILQEIQTFRQLEREIRDMRVEAIQAIQAGGYIQEGPLTARVTESQRVVLNRASLTRLLGSHETAAIWSQLPVMTIRALRIQERRE